MLGRLFTQRRRFLFGQIGLFTLVYVAMLNGFISTDMDAGSWIDILAVFLAVLILFLPAMIVVTFGLPGWRNIVEILVIALAIDFALGVAIPEKNLSGLWSTVQLLAIVFIVERLLYGSILTGNRKALPKPRRRVFKTKAPPDAVWAALLPHPDYASRHWYPGTQVSNEKNEEGAYFVTYPVRGQEPLCEWVTIEAAQAPNQFRTSFHLTHPGDKDLHSGRTEVSLTALDNGGTQVSFTEILDPAPFRRRLQWFLDDEFRDRTNSMRAQLSGKRDWSMMARQFPKDARSAKQAANMAEIFS